jgi:hypothetical protein
VKYFASRNVKYFASQNVKEAFCRAKSHQNYSLFIIHYSLKTATPFSLRHPAGAAQCSATRQVDLAKIPQNFCA